jgi:hypothetical protein
MALSSIPAPSPGWGFFYYLPSLPSSRPPDIRRTDTSGHTQGAPGRSLWRPCLRVRSSWVPSTCAISTNGWEHEQGAGVCRGYGL